MARLALGARQSSPAGASERTSARPARAPQAAHPIEADPEVERLGDIVASRLDDIDPEASSISDRAWPLWRGGSGRTRACAGCPRNSASCSTRWVACRSATSTRTFASRRRPWAGRGFLAGEDALAAECAPAKQATPRRGWRAFLALARREAPRRMRALVGRIGAGPVFADAGYATKSGVRPNAAPGSTTSSGRMPSARRSSSARRRPLANRGGALQRADRARAALAQRAQAHAVAGLLHHRPRPEPRRLDDRGLRQVRLRDARGRAALAHRGLPARPPVCMGARPCATPARWAPLLPQGDGVVLHVSGCAKGCARPAATAATLTATVAEKRSCSRGEGRRSARAARAFQRGDRKATLSEVASMFAGERPSLESGLRVRKGRGGHLSPVLRRHPPRGRPRALLSR